VVDALVFEFMGLAMIALCVIVVAVPARRRPSRQFRDYWSDRFCSARSHLHVGRTPRL